MPTGAGTAPAGAQTRLHSTRMGRPLEHAATAGRAAGVAVDEKRAGRVGYVDQAPSVISNSHLACTEPVLRVYP